MFAKNKPKTLKKRLLKTNVTDERKLIICNKENEHHAPILSFYSNPVFTKLLIKSIMLGVKLIEVKQSLVEFFAIKSTLNSEVFLVDLTYLIHGI